MAAELSLAESEDGPLDAAAVRPGDEVGEGVADVPGDADSLDDAEPNCGETDENEDEDEGCGLEVGAEANEVG